MPQLDWISFFYDHVTSVILLSMYMLSIPMITSLFLCKLWVRIFTYILRLSQFKLK